MVQPSSPHPLPLPTWLVVAGSLAVGVHLFILGVSVLAAPSGPWPTNYGLDTAPGPWFALSIDEVTRPNYLRPLKLTHNYHFLTNKSETPGVFFEVRLKGESGEVKETLRFPNQDANPWVRHRQALLAQHLLQDRPVQPPAGEVIPAPGQRVPKIQIWDMGKERALELRSVEEHRVPRDRPVSRPSDLSLTLARSYARHLCRTHGAASAEIIRHSKEPLSPVVLFQPDLPPGATDELVASFGDMPRETPQ